MSSTLPATVPRTAAGYSLAELLVAITIGLLILAGALGSVQAAWKSQHGAAARFQLHERALHVLGLLEPNLQMAGYFGLATATQLQQADAALIGSIPCGVGSIPVVGAAIEIFDVAPIASCFTQGNGPLPGSQLIVLRRASTRLADPEAGRLQMLAQSTPLPQMWLSSQGDRAAARGPPQQELRDLVLQIYYIARRSDGGDNTPALRVKTLTRIGTTPAFIDTEAMPGITNLHARLLRGPDQSLRAIVVRLTALADRSSQLQISRTVALRNGFAS